MRKLLVFFVTISLLTVGIAMGHSEFMESRRDKYYIKISDFKSIKTNVNSMPLGYNYAENIRKIIETIESYQSPLTKQDWKDIEYIITQIKGKSYDEDMSILRGKILLLEMEIKKLKGDK